MAIEPTRNDTCDAFGLDALTVLQPGVCVAEFEIIRTLGEGGFGIVYLAVDHSLKRQVAIKEYMPATLAVRGVQGQVNVRADRSREAFDAGLLGFLKEARLLAFFDHPSLLKVYRYWQANGTAYMAMPYLQGKTLNDTLRERGEPPSEAWLLDLLAPLTEALQVLHDQQCFHRDIAPDNIMMLAQSERPLLLDFGAARRVIGDVTQALTVILKPGYAPVEQYGESDGWTQGPWTDVYALGAVVHYAMLGATPPLSATRLLDDTALPLMQAAAGRYSPNFLAAIDRALAVRPQERTQSMAQLRLELGLTGVPGRRECLDPSGDANTAVTPNASVPQSAQLSTRDTAAQSLPSCNLPEQSTRFLGREAEVKEIKRNLRTSRLVTLVGMGGLGKTRLSLQVGAEVLASQPDGVWFLDLSVILEARLVATHLVQLFDLHDEPGRTLVQTLAAFLKPRKLLLIFDNCEHLVGACADLAHALLRQTADVRILASSRETLKVPGEQVCAVFPLALPPPGGDLASVLQSTAVRLFVERAQDHKPSFALTEKDAPAVVELMARLEGIPLALELAAARVRAMSVSDINQRLNDRYKLLNRGSEFLHPRQQTLRALVDWSYDMLQDDEKTLFNRLGVFVGGLDMASAEVVCSAAPLDSDLVMDLLSSLVEKSLVMMEERDGTTRYRMLETLRDYALEKLTASGEAPACAAAHGQHYFALSKQIREGLKGKDQGLWIRCAESDIDNLRAAICVGPKWRHRPGDHGEDGGGLARLLGALRSHDRRPRHRA